MIAATVSAIDLALIDATLCDAAQLALPLAPLEPLNSEDEQAKVAADPGHQPQFVYLKQEQASVETMRATLDRLALPDGVSWYFHEAREYLLKRLTLRLHLGDDEYWAQPLYPAAPQTVRTLARGILADPPPPTEPPKRPFRSNHVVKLIQARFDQYGLKDWRVLARHNLSSTNTDSANRVVNVRADISYSLEEMKRLVVHEVDTHVLRSANGALQPFRALAVGAAPSYLMTEEGLAVINEERMGYVETERTRLFAGRVLASHRAATGSFSEVYTEQRDYGFGHDEAFLTTKRVKRGLHDTAQPGGFLKDHAYLWGRVLVEEFVLGGGNLWDLYAGKISIEHLALKEELSLEPATYLPLPYI